MRQEELRQLLEDMSLEEKIGQMVQLSADFYKGDAKSVITGPAASLGVTGEDIRLAGSILGAYGAEELMEIQKNYMAEHPHHIPMLFMLDVIHGLKTVFPIPLAQGAAFEPELAQKCASAMTKEAAVSGLHVTFAPMADLVRDARWGRVMESTGEDPYLNGKYAAAMVRGIQGDDMSKPYKMSACIKHFAGYGAVEAGREYNNIEVNEHTFREFYLPAYEEGIRAGAGMVMTAFNPVNGIPATGNRRLMRDVLRGEMGFDGVLITDYGAILEMIAHGYAEDEKDAAHKAVEAGADIDMMTNAYAANLKQLVEEKKIDEALIDEAAFRILELKNKLGLFENPYKDADAKAQGQVRLCSEHRALAREAAQKTCVLLKNDGILPLDMSKKIAFIGPYTNNHEIHSTWAFTGDVKECVTIEAAACEVFDISRTTFHQGAPVVGSDVRLSGFASDTASGKVSAREQEAMLDEAVLAASKADLVVMPLGEHYLQSGEAASRAMIDLPEVQMTLFRAVAKVNPNIVVVLFNGRPLDLREISEKSRAVLEVWLPGTEGGHAVVDVLTGAVNPSGKLTMSFPYCVGQEPMHYNEYATGRPYDRNERLCTRYTDVPNEPLYPFGYGLSYTNFDISPIRMSGSEVTEDAPLTAQVTVKNTGDCSGTEVVQLYIRDMTASVIRPVKELKGFQKIWLAPGEEKEVFFEIDEPMLRFVRSDGTWGSESGKFTLWIGSSSMTENGAQFELKL